MFAKSPCLPQSATQLLSRFARRACVLGGLALISGTGAIAVGSIAVGSIAVAPDRVMAQDADQAILDNDEIFTRYVSAAVEIENERQKLKGELATLMGGDIPRHPCGSIDQMPEQFREQARVICASYERYVLAIAYHKHKLKPEEFNVFQRRVKNDPKVRQQFEQKQRALIEQKQRALKLK